MFTRRSNYAAGSRISEPPTFHALAWVEQPDSRRLAFIVLDRDCHTLDELALRDIAIDGTKHFCVEVRTFARAPYKKGDTVGVVVVG